MTSRAKRVRPQPETKEPESGHEMKSRNQGRYTQARLSNQPEIVGADVGVCVCAVDCAFRSFIVQAEALGSDSAGKWAGKAGGLDYLDQKAQALRQAVRATIQAMIEHFQGDPRYRAQVEQLRQFQPACTSGSPTQVDPACLQVRCWCWWGRACHTLMELLAISKCIAHAGWPILVWKLAWPADHVNYLEGYCSGCGREP